MTTRRRFLTILGSATALPLMNSASAALGRWSGITLGAKSTILLDHPNADRLMAGAVDEIHRLESIFSLYQKDSQISRLNRDGVLEYPAFEMIELLSICSDINSRTNGAFDPTIQPLWALYAQMFADGQKPKPVQIAQALQQTGWEHVKFDPSQVSFGLEKMSLTLNGIAQGYIADRITAYFRNNGVGDVLVNTGEISAIGHGPDGNGWNVKLANSDQSPILLSNCAIATSATTGTVFDNNALMGHIIDPRTGIPGGIYRQISVKSTSAARADGLSTAFCLLSEVEIDRAKGKDEVFFA